jgi:hypothetical protein
MRSLKCFFIPLFAFVLLLAPACRVKSGCPSNADMSPKKNKKGILGGKKSNATGGIFPSKVKKKTGIKG